MEDIRFLVRRVFFIREAELEVDKRLVRNRGGHSFERSEKLDEFEDEGEDVAVFLRVSEREGEFSVGIERGSEGEETPLRTKAIYLFGRLKTILSPASRRVSCPICPKRWGISMLRLLCYVLKLEHIDAPPPSTSSAQSPVSAHIIARKLVTVWEDRFEPRSI